MITSPTPSRLLREDPSYLITGGTGGIGRSITRWLAHREARNIILAFRSGGGRGEIHELIKEIFALGVKVVAEKCDITVPQDVSRLLA